MGSFLKSGSWKIGLVNALCTIAIFSNVMGQEAKGLRVSDDHRYLLDEDGKPFFYLGDTAWELFHRSTREEALKFLDDRAAKGFTVIQAVALAEFDGLRTPNAYGHVPLIADDPTKPSLAPEKDDDYWDHVDFIVDQANTGGMYIGLLPTWGDKWNRRWGVGPVIFDNRNAEIYGKWLGERYRDHGIIWILGGDRPIDTPEQRTTIDAMARGIRAGDNGRHLMTFHPSGRTNSADLVHEADWLSFNMVQSGHERPAQSNFEYMLKNLEKRPLKPTLDGEPCYEDHPIKGKTWNQRNEAGVLLSWFDEWDVRVAAYQSILAGACGHTYGDHNIWQMWRPDREAISVARTPWTIALNHPGAQQMKYFRELFERRPFWKLRSDQKLIASDNPKGIDHIRAAKAVDDSFAIFYIATGKPLTVDLAWAGSSWNAYWLNPRQNSSQWIGAFQSMQSRSFSPPTSGRNNDWVLVIDRADNNLPQIGFSHQNLTPKN